MNLNTHKFIEQTKKIFEECFLLDFLEDYQKEEIKESIDKYIEKLNILLNGDNITLPNELYPGIILSKDFNFKQEFIKLLLNSNLEEEQFNKVVEYGLLEYSPSFIIMSMEQKDAHYLESVLINLKIKPNTEEAADMFFDAFEALTEKMGLNEDEYDTTFIKFEEKELINILQKYLDKNKVIVANADSVVNIKINEYVGREDYPLQSSLVEILMKISGRDNIGKFSPYLPFLPKADSNQAMFVEAPNPITVITINQNGLLGKFPNLLSEGNIFEALINITTAINETELPQIKRSEYLSKVENDNLTILFFSNNDNELNKKQLENLLTIAIENYVELNNESINELNNNGDFLEIKNKMNDNLKDIIHQTWLDIIIPNNNNKKAKKKI